MRSRTAPLLLVSMLCLVPGSAWAVGNAVSPDDTIWMTVLLNGRKIGHEEIRREQTGDEVITTQTLVMDIERNHRPTLYTNVSRNVETADGEAIGFTMTSLISATQTKVEGRVLPDGVLELTNTAAGSSRRSVTVWPQGTLLVEGQRRLMQAAIDHPGMRYHLLVYDQATQQPMDVEVAVIGKERVDLPGGTETLSHQRKTLRTLENTQVADLWLDAQGNVRKGSLSLLGQPMDLIACSQACASAPTQSLDMMDTATVESPRLITAEMLGHFLSYRVHITNRNIAHPFIATDEQSVIDLGDGVWQVSVSHNLLVGQSPPAPADTQPNAWLQSDDPEIRQLAATAADGEANKRRLMRKLDSFVSRYLTQRGLDIGYASALEVARDRRGNCAEFAVLLAALARAQNIPARVVVGMIYTDRYDNKSRVFIPHAWVIAWISGRWRNYDPAAIRFDTGHIALDSGDGNPWHFFNAANEFGNIRIDSVRTFSEMYDMPSPEDMQMNDGINAAPRSGGNTR
jgi:hypothetical protein